MISASEAADADRLDEGGLVGLSRLALMAELGGVSVVEPILLAAYEREAQREWRGEDGYSQTSFYVSNFPGDEPYACGRAALYGLMGIPPEKPFDTHAKRWMDAGKALEMDFIKRFADSGTLLSGDESRGEPQVKFREPGTWASGAVDAIILPFGWRKGHPVEVKNTSREKIIAMRENRASTPFSHSKYVRQLKTYIGFAHEQKWAPKVTVCKESWAITLEGPMGLRWCPIHRDLGCEVEEIQLDPPDDGTLIYASRDPERGNEIDTVSYYFSYDPDFLAAGRAKLAEWKSYFERGELPPHAREGEKKKWSEQPCRFCDFKKNACRLDDAAKTTQLSESKAFEFASRIRPQYDYDEIRSGVFDRWELEDPLKTEAVAA